MRAPGPDPEAGRKRIARSHRRLAVFLQLLMTPWLIILMKSVVRSVPHEITESGKGPARGGASIG